MLYHHESYNQMEFLITTLTDTNEREKATNKFNEIEIVKNKALDNQFKVIKRKRSNM